jgi:hypothetical protein
LGKTKTGPESLKKFDSRVGSVAFPRLNIWTRSVLKFDKFRMRAQQRHHYSEAALVDSRDVFLLKLFSSLPAVKDVLRGLKRSRDKYSLETGEYK